MPWINRLTGPTPHTRSNPCGWLQRPSDDNEVATHSAGGRWPESRNPSAARPSVATESSVVAAGRSWSIESARTEFPFVIQSVNTSAS